MKIEEEKMRLELAKAIAQKRDAIISDAITKRLGHSNWIPQQLVRRLTLFSIPGRIQETWCLDHEQLVEMWPAETTIEDGKIRVRVRFREISPSMAAQRVKIKARMESA